MEDIYVYKSALTKVYTKLNFSFYLSFQDWYELPLLFVFLVGTSKGLNTWKRYHIITTPEHS